MTAHESSHEEIPAKERVSGGLWRDNKARLDCGFLSQQQNKHAMELCPSWKEVTRAAKSLYGVVIYIMNPMKKRKNLRRVGISNNKKSLF